MADNHSQIISNLNLNDFSCNDTERLRVIEEAKKLISRLQYKEERIFDITFSQPIVFAALQTFLDLGLWAGWTKAGGPAKTTQEICELCEHNVEPNLLRRMLRLLASVNIVEETGEDIFRATPFSLCLGDRESFVPQTIQCSTYHCQMSCLNLPKYLAKIGYKEPQDAKDSNYADAYQEDFFGKCMAEPLYQDAFSGFMRGWAKYKLPWPEIFDTSSLLDGADLESAPLCVDVGGHHGVDLSRLLNRHPDLPSGSLVLQDLPDCLSEVRGLSDKIRILPHNMFDAQPIKGARAYYFHAVLHDWPDNTALIVLKNTAAAMKKGYSKLLINDIAIPPTGASWIQTTMDVEMMALLSAYERSEAMWTSLLTGAGFKIIKFLKDSRGNESLIEAELA
ncbi:S-adenosyl-L-methionine-dependent methyltransferase [Xylariaceae sp. AK1471]|nr:S-adenosyl-L-methionine-dependent methyltransferase [Xylariaceae sp. AK1471]